MHSRRVAGKIHTGHIASLGSVDAEVSVRGRLAFWAKMPDRMARLGNRVGPDEQGKIYGALHARIPLVTPDDQRAIQTENAEDDERFWDTVHDMNASTIAEHKALIATAETKIAELAPKAREAAEKMEAAKARLEKVRRGEVVAGGLGKRVDLHAMLKAILTPEQFRRVKMMSKADLTEAEFESALAASLADHEPTRAADRIFDREVRRVIRARQP